MPQFGVLPEEKAVALAPKSPKIDLTPYKDYIASVETGKWYFITPEPGTEETFSIIRRRVNSVKREMKLDIQTKHGDGEELYFRVNGPAAEEATNTAPAQSRSARSGSPPAESLEEAAD